MKPSLIRKLDALVERHEEIGLMLGDPEVMNDQNLFRDLSKEYAQLEDVVSFFRQWQDNLRAQQASQALLNDDDKELQQLAHDELAELKPQAETLQQNLQVLLLPRDPNDDRNTFLEIRAGTGGDEAAIFAGDLFRMYSRYAENKGWQLEIMSQNLGEHGGL